MPSPFRALQWLGRVNAIAQRGKAWQAAGMEITVERFAQIEHCLPRQRGNVSLSNLQLVNAIRYVAELAVHMAGSSPAFWQLAHDLHAHEALDEGGHP